MEMNYLRERTSPGSGRRDCLQGKGLSADSPRILIVDDEELVLNFLHDALDMEKYSLHQAGNGHAALAAVASFKPDVILLDLGLEERVYAANQS